MQFFGPIRFPDWFSRNGVKLDDARSILGKHNVLLEKEVKKVVGSCKGADRLLYTREVLEAAAALNEEGKRWVLYPVHQFSLWRLREKQPADFCDSSVFVKHNKWIDIAGEAGYRLINLKPERVDVPLDEVMKVDGRYAAAFPSTVAECALVWKVVHDEKIIHEVGHISSVVEDMLPLIRQRVDGQMIVCVQPQETLQRFGMPHFGVIDVWKIPTPTVSSP